MIIPCTHPLLHNLHTSESADRTVVPVEAAAWTSIVEDACAHGMAGPLACWLASADLPYSLPRHLKARLRDHMAGIAARNVILDRELAAILRSCRQSRIPCVPLRGMALEVIFGRNISLRPSGDIDLLIRRDDLGAAADILQTHGYTEFDRRPGFSPDYSYTLEFVTPRHGGILIEPHWTIAYPPFVGAIDMDAVWRRCTDGTVAGVETRHLSREDLLIHLCLHLLHHGTEAPLLWWYELDLLIRRTQASLNWNTIAAIAGEAGQSFLVREVLQILREQLHTPIPRPALTSLAAQRPRTPLTSLLAHAPTVNGREEFAQFVSLPGFRTKLHYAFSLLFPSPAYMRHRYDAYTPARIGIAYLGRILRIGRDGIRWATALLGAMRSTKPSLSP